jgi:competence protein ComEA
MNNQSNKNVNWFHIGLTMLFSVAATVIFFALNNQISPAPIIINPAPTLPLLPTDVPMPVTIFVNGAVNAAGVYELEAGSRVEDAVGAAGGFSADAYTSNINLAAELNDGMQLFVSTQEQADALQNQLFANPIQSPIQVAQSIAAGIDATGRVNINTADRDELETIPSVGPATAENIIGYREENGPFKTIEEIMNVSGIGEGKFEDMQEFITVGNE